MIRPEESVVVDMFVVILVAMVVNECRAIGLLDSDNHTVEVSQSLLTGSGAQYVCGRNGVAIRSL